MFPDAKLVEQLVQVITHEVLAVMMEKQEKDNIPQGVTCKYECAEKQCVHTCFDETGHVVSAGAERLSSTIGIIPQDTTLAKMIDHTLLKPDATQEQIAQLCYEARKYGFAAVCVNPTYVKLCSQLLKGSQPLVDNRDNKTVVTSLREIAANKVRYSHPELLDRVEEQAKQIGDDMGFIGDEDDSE